MSQQVRCLRILFIRKSKNQKNILVNLGKTNLTQGRVNWRKDGKALQVSYKTLKSVVDGLVPRCLCSQMTLYLVVFVPRCLCSQFVSFLDCRSQFVLFLDVFVPRLHRSQMSRNDQYVKVGLFFPHWGLLGVLFEFFFSIPKPRSAQLKLPQFMSHMLNFGLKSKLKGYDPIGQNFFKSRLLASIFFKKMSFRASKI